MRFLAALSFASAAFVALASADVGCEVDLESTLASPADSGEIILYSTQKSGKSFASNNPDLTPNRDTHQLGQLD